MGKTRELRTLMDGFRLYCLAEGKRSTTVVYHILERLLEAAESLVRGEATDIIDAREQLAKARLNQELVQHRLQLAARLTQLQQQLDIAVNPDQLKRELERMINSLMPFELEDEQSELQVLKPDNVPQALSPTNPEAVM